MKSEVYNCDCVEYMRTLPDKCFQLAIADPPYGDGHGGGMIDSKAEQLSPGTRRNYPPPTARHYAFGIRKCRKSYENRRNLGGEIQKKIVGWDEAPSQEFFEQLFRVSKHQIIWGANYFNNMPATRCFIVWRKLTISESFSMAMAEYAWTSFEGNAKVVEMAPQGDPKDPRFHPTQKPVALYAWILKKYAKAGDTIFDPMMGSQSSRIAAHKLGFDYVGCELDEEYFERGCERYERECLGITVTENGQRYKQTALF